MNQSSPSLSNLEDQLQGLLKDLISVEKALNGFIKSRKASPPPPSTNKTAQAIDESPPIPRLPEGLSTKFWDFLKLLIRFIRQHLDVVFSDKQFTVAAAAFIKNVRVSNTQRPTKTSSSLITATKKDQPQKKLYLRKKSSAPNLSLKLCGGASLANDQERVVRQFFETHDFIVSVLSNVEKFFQIGNHAVINPDVYVVESLIMILLKNNEKFLSFLITSVQCPADDTVKIECFQFQITSSFRIDTMLLKIFKVLVSQWPKTVIEMLCKRGNTYGPIDEFFRQLHCPSEISAATSALSYHKVFTPGLEIVDILIWKLLYCSLNKLESLKTGVAKDPVSPKIHQSSPNYNENTRTSRQRAIRQASKLNPSQCATNQTTNIDTSNTIDYQRFTQIILDFFFSITNKLLNGWNYRLAGNIINEWLFLIPKSLKFTSYQGTLIDCLINSEFSGNILKIRHLLNFRLIDFEKTDSINKFDYDSSIRHFASENDNFIISKLSQILVHCFHQYYFTETKLNITDKSISYYDLINPIRTSFVAEFLKLVQLICGFDFQDDFSNPFPFLEHLFENFTWKELMDTFVLLNDMLQLTPSATNKNLSSLLGKQIMKLHQDFNYELCLWRFFNNKLDPPVPSAAASLLGPAGASRSNTPVRNIKIKTAVAILNNTTRVTYSEGQSTESSHSFRPRPPPIDNLRLNQSSRRVISDTSPAFIQINGAPENSIDDLWGNKDPTQMINMEDGPRKIQSLTSLKNNDKLKDSSKFLAELRTKIDKKLENSNNKTPANSKLNCSSTEEEYCMNIDEVFTSGVNLKVIPILKVSLIISRFLNNRLIKNRNESTMVSDEFRLYLDFRRLFESLFSTFIRFWIDSKSQNSEADVELLMQLITNCFDIFIKEYYNNDNIKINDYIIAKFEGLSHQDAVHLQIKEKIGLGVCRNFDEKLEDELKILIRENRILNLMDGDWFQSLDGDTIEDNLYYFIVLSPNQQYLLFKKFNIVNIKNSGPTKSHQRFQCSTSSNITLVSGGRSLHEVDSRVSGGISCQEEYQEPVETIFIKDDEFRFENPNLIDSDNSRRLYFNDIKTVSIENFLDHDMMRNRFSFLSLKSNIASSAIRRPLEFINFGSKRLQSYKKFSIIDKSDRQVVKFMTDKEEKTILWNDGLNMLVRESRNKRASTDAGPKSYHNNGYLSEIVDNETKNHFEMLFKIRRSVQYGPWRYQRIDGPFENSTDENYSSDDDTNLYDRELFHKLAVS